MTMSTKLPAVLQRPHGNSISIERALNQIKLLLTQYPTDASWVAEDTIMASIDDVDTMLKCIDRS